MKQKHKKESRRDIVCVLSDIRSVHNTASMFRTADGVGISKMFLCGITPTPLDRLGVARPDFKKVSLGAEKFVPWEYASSALRVIGRLKREGYFIIALEQDKRAMPYRSFQIKERKIALVVGSETDGIKMGILDRADAVIDIPMKGKKESLNVSVAFGIAAYYLCA